MVTTALRRPRLPRRELTAAAGPVAVRFELRTALLCVLAAALLALVAAWAMTLGTIRLPLGDVARAAVGLGDSRTEFVVRELRMPRVLSAVLIGALLAAAGAIFQGVVRNPLVSPDIIGVNAGATVAAAWWILSGQDRTLLTPVVFAAASATAAAVYLLSWRGGVSTLRLVLIGIGVNAILQACVTVLMLRYPAQTVASAYLWMAGSVYASQWTDVRLLAGTAAVLLPLAAVMMFPLRVLQFGDPLARGLGMRVELTRLGLLATGCALAGTAVAFAGPVGFIAFAVPHMARALGGALSGGVLILTALLGGLLLLLADQAAQHALPVQLPVGVVTAALGGPYFLLILWRYRPV